MKSLPKKQPQPKKAAEKAVTMPLEAINYILIAFGALVIAGSYWGMYLEREVDGFFALFISPVTLIGAYVLIAFALLYRPKPEKKQAG
jgi:predicted MFS family arabinose efflux permease